jgi:hypothetical protein
MRPTRAIASFTAASLAAVALAACGSSGGSGSSGGPPEPPAKLPSANAVVQIGGHVITRAALNEWMTVDIGTDYYELIKRQVPAQLVSEPVNYTTCTHALKRAEAAAGGGASPQTAAQLHSKCEALYRAIKEQTLAFLVNAYWSLDFGASHGIDVTDAEAERTIAQAKATEYPKPGAFEASLKARRRTAAQELFLAKADLIERELERRVASDATLKSDVGASAKDAVCRAEYVVAHCKEQASLYTGPPIATLLREVAQ